MCPSPHAAGPLLRAGAARERAQEREHMAAIALLQREQLRRARAEQLESLRVMMAGGRARARHGTR